MNDEQLDALMESVTDARAYGRPTMVYTEERIRHETYVSLSTDVVEQLITALRAERAAHQATKAELKAARRYIESLEIALRDSVLTTEEADELELSEQLYLAARAGQGEGE